MRQEKCIWVKNNEGQYITECGRIENEKFDYCTKCMSEVIIKKEIPKEKTCKTCAYSEFNSYLEYFVVDCWDSVGKCINYDKWESL